MQENDAVQNDTPQYHPVEVRRSFRYLSMDAIFYIVGISILDQSTVLPAFLSTLTDSPILIGALIAIRPAGAFLPQLLVMHYLRNRTLHKGFLIKIASVSRIAVTLFALVLFFAGPNDKALMLWSFMIMYTLFWFSEGCCGVSWTDILAKTIPERIRGRLFGVMQVVGGLLAILAGIFVSRMLAPSGPAYPTNYAILAAVAAFFFSASLFSLSRVREPVGISEEHDGDFFCYTRRIGKMIAQRGQLKLLLMIQLLIGFFGMSMPFYILYAKETVGITGELVGIFLSVQMAGSIVSALAAGWMSDHHSPKIVIMLSILSAIFASVLALFVAGLPLWVFGALFFLIGWMIGSGWIGFTNFLLELADPRDRRPYVGLLNLVCAPTIIFPVLGGTIVEVFSYKTVFGFTAVMVTAALLLSLRLKCRRSEEI